MARRRDPLRNFNYRVEISGFNSGFGFSNVDGLNRSMEVIEYREGGDNHTPRKMPGQASFDNIVLERGKYVGSDADEVLVWAEECYNHSEGVNQAIDGFRRTVDIYLLDRDGTERRHWRAEYAWVAEYQHDALAGDGNDVFMERIELAHEGLKEVILNNN